MMCQKDHLKNYFLWAAIKPGSKNYLSPSSDVPVYNSKLMSLKSKVNYQVQVFLLHLIKDEQEMARPTYTL